MRLRHASSPSAVSSEPSDDHAADANAPASDAPAPALSSLPAGTPLQLGYIKGAPEPVALPDEAYPAWLWRLLDNGGRKADRTDEASERRRLRDARRVAVKTQNKLKGAK